MLLEIILALVFGITIGTITGLFPGIHINLVSAFLLLASPILLLFAPPLALVVFIIALAMTHTFVDFVPSIFLGAPNEDTVLSILPGHQLLLDGLGYFAVVLTVYGGFLGIGLLLLMTPIFLKFLPIIYPYVTRIIPIILIIISGFLIFSESRTKRLWALFIFLFSGFLGIATLGLPMKDPLLPLFTGLFGASGLILSIKNQTKIPDQKKFRLKEMLLPKSSLLKGTFATIIASPFTAILPGMGSSQAAIIGSEVTGDLNEKEFLFVVGGVNILVTSLAFVAFYSINKTRSGAAVAISKLIENPTSKDLVIMILAVIISGIIAGILSINLAKYVSNKINKFNYSKISIMILIVLTIITIIFSGFLGMIIFVTSTALGIVCIEKGVKRTELMGSLLIPTIMYYLL